VRTFRTSDGNKRSNNTYTSYGSSASNGDIIGCAIDFDSGKIWFSINGTWQASGNPATGSNAAFSDLSGEFYPIFTAYVGTSSNTSFWTGINFGQRPFAYPLSGFKALCTTNLPAPVVTKPSSVFDVVTYTGTGSTLTPTSSLGFNPDLVWIKSRSAATDNTLYDSVRGAQARLESNTTDAEVTSDNGLTAFNSNGFTLGTLAQVNTNAATYAGWCWDACSSTVTNTAGSITSSVTANASAGFSIISATLSGAGATVGHGLNIAPALVIGKDRDTNATNWVVYHSFLGAGKNIQINTTAAAVTDSNYWNNVSPTSTVFSVGSYLSGPFIFYAFAPVNSYSAFGSYTGNGSTDGPFVFCNFRPRWLIIKNTSAVGDWFIYDSARLGYNVSNELLKANTSDSEIAGTAAPLDILSNGIKIRMTTGNTNASGQTYIYAAFAENPFQYARAR
jgi:hypothetical protein